MNGLLIVFLVALSTVTADVSEGYRYPLPGGGHGFHSQQGQQGFGASIGGFGSGVGSFGSGVGGFGSSTGASHSVFQSQQGQPGFGLNVGGVGSSNTDYFTKHDSFGLHAPHQGQHGGVHHQAPIVTKHFFTFSAPEPVSSEHIKSDIKVGTPREHYNVVFIKAPYHNARATALQIAQAMQKEKTVVYVLSKETDDSEIRSVIKEANFTPQHPEVHIVKYKSPEEALYIQNTVREKYNSIGGTEQINNEQVLNVEGGFKDSSYVTGTSGSGQIAVQSGPEYLPPSK